MTTNGQTPFVSICMYLDEVPEGRTRDDLAMIIEEVIKQRYQGTKNENGVWITPSFPKLLYVLEEDNIKEDSKYYYLTKLAAKLENSSIVFTGRIMKFFVSHPIRLTVSISIAPSESQYIGV